MSMAYSPSPSAPHSPHLVAAIVEQDKYLSELLSERNKLSPFVPVLPNCYRLLNQEILRVTTLLENASVLDQSGLEHASPLPLGGMFSNGGANMNRWTSPLQAEMSALLQPSSAQSWLGSQGGSSGLVTKRTMRVDIPVATYPNFNFVGRLLGPRVNSLRRVEASTDCRVLIRGRGSIKDPAKDETHDFYKKQQLRELAMLNDTLREESFQMSGLVSPFNNSLGMKRAKTTE